MYYWFSTFKDNGRLVLVGPKRTYMEAQKYADGMSDTREYKIIETVTKNRQEAKEKYFSMSGDLDIAASYTAHKFPGVVESSDNMKEDQDYAAYLGKRIGSIPHSRPKSFRSEYSPDTQSLKDSVKEEKIWL